ncbi:Beta-barrel assembly machine subunit BamD [Nonlabens sp. Hel1_33_55]|uniref:outer membrane protein assembly factor BamD n=1 Tax=Nonlabens sp. Hel1_33_55 TaxID=1336802 RepID=UPI000875B157|nr:outer membrane protein assembly factor BamD [Nonlabens sp. Hel1_33_55]SCY13511.1 Beta-barrel assembly machine subunit BamD [Nonlabens sp. Hel1_33_55]
MKQITVLLLIVFAVVGCSNYQKALKSSDAKLKVRTADSLLAAEKYSKAINLLEQVVPAYRGTDSAAPVALKYANALYQDGRYPESGYQFETYRKSYVSDPNREYATFMIGKSLYEMAPIYSKDQEPTEKALAKFQDYINIYPNGEYLAEANMLVDEMQFKLDKKAYEIAENYFKRAPFSRGGYTAAIASFENFIVDHPGSEFQDDAAYHLIDSQYSYAIKSFSSLIPERLEVAKEYYDTFATRFPNSEYKEQADDLMEKINSYNN